MNYPYLFTATLETDKERADAAKAKSMKSQLKNTTLSREKRIENGINLVILFSKGCCVLKESGEEIVTKTANPHTVVNILCYMAEKLHDEAANAELVKISLGQSKIIKCDIYEASFFAQRCLTIACNNDFSNIIALYDKVGVAIETPSDYCKLKKQDFSQMGLLNIEHLYNTTEIPIIGMS